MKFSLPYLTVSLSFLRAEAKSLRPSLPATPDSDESRDLVEATCSKNALKYNSSLKLQNNIRWTRFLAEGPDNGVNTFSTPDDWVISSLARKNDECVKFGDKVLLSKVERECFSIDPITLKPDLSTGDSLNRQYTPELMFPIATSSGDAICDFKLESKCQSDDFFSAPTCEWEIYIDLNKGGTTCDDPNAIGRRFGTIFASGTGPAAYNVKGGDFDFAAAFGQLDSVFNIKTQDLEGFTTVGEVCYTDQNDTEPKLLSTKSGNAVFISNGIDNVDGVEQTQFIIRSDLGNGSRDFPDLRQGRCVEDGDKIHLQANSVDSRWISGSRNTGNIMVYSQDLLGSSYERTRAFQNYVWIVRANES